MEGCAFEGNHAGQRGGGYYYVDTDRTDARDMYDCSFRGNRSIAAGGAVYEVLGRAQPSDHRFNKVHFEANYSLLGLAIAVNVLGFYEVRDLGMDSCSFIKHKPLYPSEDPGFVVYFPVIDILESKCTVTNLLYEENMLKSGVGVLVDFPQSRFKMVEAQIRGNSNHSTMFLLSTPYVSVEHVDAMSNEEINLIFALTGPRKAMLFNSKFLRNGVVNTYLASYGQDTVIISNCLFSNNIYKTSNTSTNTNYWLVQNSCLDRDYGAVALNFNSFITLRNNWAAAAPTASGFLTLSDNLFNVPPAFRDTAAGDYRLHPCSPLIDAGLNDGIPSGTTDLAGDPRIQGGKVDIGCYEAPAFSLADSAAVTASCAGLVPPVGSVGLGASDGCGGYTYAWSSPTAGSGTDTTGLAPGAYTFTVTDYKGRSLVRQVVVPEGQPATLSPSVEALVCGTGLGGSVSLSPSGGTAPFSYLWSTGDSTAVLSGLAGGSYSVTLSDAAGCTSTAMAEVSSSGGLVLQVSGQAVSCFGLADGWYAASPLTGLSPFAYAWAHGPQDSVATGLWAGDYGVTVTDALGCTAQYAFQMPEPDSLSFIVSQVSASGPANADGSLHAWQAQGGTPPYDYAWSNGPTMAFNPGLLPGLYTLTLSDQNGCTAAWTYALDWSSGTSSPGAGAWLLYPNPTRGMALLKAPEGAGALRSADLVDAQGRAVGLPLEAAGEGLWELRLPGLPAGAYRLVLRGEGGAWGFSLVLGD
jgi:SprB repeat